MMNIRIINKRDATKQNAAHDFLNLMLLPAFESDNKLSSVLTQRSFGDVQMVLLNSTIE